MELRNGWIFRSDPLLRKGDFPRSEDVRTVMVKKAYLRLIMERRTCSRQGRLRMQTLYQGSSMVTEAVMEDAGPLMWSFLPAGDALPG